VPDDGKPDDDDDGKDDVEARIHCFSAVWGRDIDRVRFDDTVGALLAHTGVGWPGPMRGVQRPDDEAQGGTIVHGRNQDCFLDLEHRLRDAEWIQRRSLETQREERGHHRSMPQ
jgi:hypothetical protein